MAKIKNAEQLRDYLLDSLEQVEKGKIDIQDLSIISKTSETIMSGIKTQLAYAHMRGEKPIIPFLQDCHQIETIKISKKDN